MTRKILIIGATSAIAQATARLFAEQQDALFLIGRNTSQLQTITADLKTQNARCYASQLLLRRFK